MAKHSISAYSCVIDFVGNTPEPVLIAKYIEDAKADLKKNGFKGDQYYVAAHSLGTVFTQNYTIKHASDFKGQMMMGGSLIRSMYVNNNNTGETEMINNVPTLVLAGSRDGLYRISRNAETYYHLVHNINKKQAKNYDVQLLDGYNHASFFDAKYNSGFVKSHDLVSEVPQKVAIVEIAKRMAAFVAKQENVKEIADI